MSSPDATDTPPDTGDSTESDPEGALVRHETGDALSEAGFGDVLVLSHEQADRVLTPARRDIIRTLAGERASSLRDLAGRLDRDPGNLSRDLQVLVAENVIRYVEDGRAKRPELKHDAIVREPLVASEGLFETD